MEYNSFVVDKFENIHWKVTMNRPVPCNPMVQICGKNAKKNPFLPVDMKESKLILERKIVQR